nr:MAG TPA: hypothetical protein [Caudoviricetes sp.]
MVKANLIHLRRRLHGGLISTLIAERRNLPFPSRITTERYLVM